MQGGSVAEVQTAAVEECVDGDEEEMKVQTSWSSTAGSTATSFESRITMETASFAEQETAEPELIGYTPEEMACNDLMIHIEGEALEKVQLEAIDAHSAALQ